MKTDINKEALENTADMAFHLLDNSGGWDCGASELSAQDICREIITHYLERVEAFAEEAAEDD